MSSEIKNPDLWQDGELKISWAYNHMPLLQQIIERFKKEKPFENKKIALSVHLEAKTAVLCLCLWYGGAEMFVTGSNPLSTQDDVAAALAHRGLNVFAHHGTTEEEYAAHIEKVIGCKPDIIIDDGGDLINSVYTKHPELIDGILGGCEETTTGINRLRVMDKKSLLKFPMMNVNDADCKHLFDNRYGTGQSVFDGINRTTNLVVAGKNVVVAGYGWCGKGVAMRAKGMGAKVTVTEVDPVKSIEAVMDGFNVMTMDKASKIGDLFITVTGCCSVIDERHFHNLKDGAILCNAGHFDIEIDVKKLKELSSDSYPARNNITCYTIDGKKIYVISEGRLVNLAAGDGHPAEIMDMSFAIQALCAEYLALGKAENQKGLLSVPREIDNKVAEMVLKSKNINIDSLTETQKQYLGI